MFNLSQDKCFHEALKHEGNSFVNCTRSLEKLLLFFFFIPNSSPDAELIENEVYFKYVTGRQGVDGSLQRARGPVVGPYTGCIEMQDRSSGKVTELEGEAPCNTDTAFII